MNILFFPYFLSIILITFHLFHPINAKRLLRSNNVKSNSKERIKQKQIINDHTEKDTKRVLSYNDNYLSNSTSFLEGLNISNSIQKLDTLDSYIVGGTEVSSETTYPYLVSILEVDMWTNTAIHQCAGTLITPDIVLTAGHCVEYSAMRIIDVGRFDWYDDDNVEPYRIEQVYIHPDFNGNFFVNDVALVKLNRKVTGISKYAKLLRDSYAINIDDSISIIGWGLTSDNGNPSKNLLEAGVSVISKTECQKTYGKFISDAMFCAYGWGKDACQGDSGGPAFKIINNEIYQIGIISWGESCGVNPGVYTNLESPIIMNFINEYMCQLLSPQSCTNGLFYGTSYSSKQQQDAKDIAFSKENNKCINTNNDDCVFISIMPALGCLMAYEECPEVCCPTSCRPDLGCVV